MIYNKPNLLNGTVVFLIGNIPEFGKFLADSYMDTFQITTQRDSICQSCMIVIVIVLKLALAVLYYNDS